LRTPARNAATESQSQRQSTRWKRLEREDILLLIVKGQGGGRGI
jgi:hypothetical protein